MKILKFYWSLLMRFVRWWNTNATKRWLLALDRMSICYLFTVVFEGMKDAAGISEDPAWLALAWVAVVALFIILYTPSYMYPNSSEPVGYPPKHCSEDDLKEKKP